MKYQINLQLNKNSSDGSIMGKVNDFQESFQTHEELGLNLVRKSPMISACDRKVRILNRHNKKEINALMFGSNSYLGATILENAIERSIEITKKFGIGSGGVPLLSGTTVFQTDLEKLIANITGFDDTILFSSGFTANLGTLLGLLRPNNLIIHDKLNHASLIDGTVISGAQIARYKHNDMSSLENVLQENYKKYLDGMIIATDGVFSMDGDIANIPKILELAKRYKALLLIDEAHATGVIGEKGAGTLDHYGIQERENIIVTGTLSKSIGTIGGYVTANQKIINYLRVYARSNMYSTSLPPSVCASAIEVFNSMKNTDIVMKLSENSQYLRNKLRLKGYNILNSETSIIPIIIGDAHKLTMMSKDFLECGVIVSYVFPPVVSPKLSRLRVSVMATHTKDDMDYFISVLDKVFKKYELSTLV